MKKLEDVCGLAAPADELVKVRQEVEKEFHTGDGI
jgi:hypothetical protein